MVHTKLPCSVIITCQVKGEYRTLRKPKDETETEGAISGVSGTLLKRVYSRMESSMMNRSRIYSVSEEKLCKEVGRTIKNIHAEGMSHHLYREVSNDGCPKEPKLATRISRCP